MIQNHLRRIPFLSLTFLVVGVAVLMTQPLRSQSLVGNGERFHLGLVLGTNLAQIDGDPYKGYRKWGLHTGIEGFASLKKNRSLSVGVLFNQLGAYPSPTEQKRDGENYLDFRLTYLEIPLVLHFLSGKKENYYTNDLQIGLSMSRLLSTRITSTRIVDSGGPSNPQPFFDIVDRQEVFRDFTPNVLLAYSRYLHPNWGLSLRHTYALRSFFKPDDQDDNLEPLRSFFFSLSLTYALR